MLDVSALLDDGWKYTDVPWLAHDAWEQFVKVLGPENHHVLAYSERSDARRGQFIISPEGVRHMGAYLEQLEKKH